MYYGGNKQFFQTFRHYLLEWGGTQRANKNWLLKLCYHPETNGSLENDDCKTKLYTFLFAYHTLFMTLSICVATGGLHSTPLYLHLFIKWQATILYPSNSSGPSTRKKDAHLRYLGSMDGVRRNKKLGHPGSVVNKTYINQQCRSSKNM